MSDWLPGISQLKSLVQLIGGDKEGAKRTQINFSKQCPGVSQIRSVVQIVSGDPISALQTQRAFLGTVSDIIDSIPYIGHVKGVVHYCAGDRSGGDDAMKAASRTRGAIYFSYKGFCIAGPVGAVIGSLVGAFVMDGVTTIFDSRAHGDYRPTGYIQQIEDLKEDPTNPGKLFDTSFSVFLDGYSGHTEGHEAKNRTKVKKQRSSNILLHGEDGRVGIHPDPVYHLHETTNDYADHNQMKRKFMDIIFPHLWTDVNCEYEDEKDE